MEIVYIAGIGIILLLGIGIWIIVRKIRKKKKFERSLRENIPQDVLDIFNEVEEKMKGGMKYGVTNNQASNPYAILWEVIQRRNQNREPEPTGTREVESSVETSTSGELYPESIRRQSVQIGDASDIVENSDNDRKPNRKNSRNIFSRFRGKPRTNQ